MPALYPEQKQRLLSYVFFLGFVVVAATLINAYVFWRDQNTTSPRVSQAIDVDAGLTITAGVSTQTFNFQTIPDDRLADLSNTQDITIRNCLGSGGSNTFANVPTNNLGFGSLNISPSASISGSKRVLVRGLSHLNQDMGCINFSQVNFTHNFNQPGQELIPGEVSNVYDNYLNSLDASGIISDLGQTTVKYDLNLDGSVDDSDLDIMLNYLYLTGD